jgi:hypothetical protein
VDEEVILSPVKEFEVTLVVVVNWFKVAVVVCFTDSFGSNDKMISS